LDRFFLFRGGLSMYAGLILACLTIGSGEERNAVEPSYEFNLVKDTSIVVAKEKDRSVFVVTNPFGIGKAGIKLKAGQWPANISLRFQYSSKKGNRFTSLELIRMTTDRIHAEGHYKASGQFAFGFLDGKGQKAFEVLDHRWIAGKLRVLVEEREGGLEVTLPRSLLAGSTKLDLYWIDAYRR
jgi:hypothetical protein